MLPDGIWDCLRQLKYDVCDYEFVMRRCTVSSLHRSSKHENCNDEDSWNSEENHVCYIIAKTPDEVNGNTKAQKDESCGHCQVSHLFSDFSQCIFLFNNQFVTMLERVEYVLWLCFFGGWMITTLHYDRFHLHCLPLVGCAAWSGVLLHMFDLCFYEQFRQGLTRLYVLHCEQ